MAVKFLGKEQQKTEPAKIKGKPQAKKRNPTKRGYPAKTFEKLFQAVANGATLAEACAAPGMPTVWTVRRRLQSDDLLNDAYNKALRIKFHGLTDELPDLPDKALEGIAKVSAADRLTAAKQKADNIKWIASRILSEYAGDGEGGNVVLNITGAADIPAVSQPASSTPTPLLKIVNGSSSGSDEGNDA